MSRRPQTFDLVQAAQGNWLDRAISSVAPQWGAKRMHARMSMSVAGSYHGADRSRRSMAGWGARVLDADAATMPGLDALRAASSSLIQNSPIASGAIATNVLNVVGTGLALNSRIDAAVLGMTDDAAKAWQDTTEREFKLFAESRDIDAGRKLNFYRLQSLAFRSTLEVGDTLVLTPSIARPGRPYRLCVQLVEGHRVCNPANQRDRAGLVGGVEIGAYGEAIAFQVAARHPGSRFYGAANTWTRVPATSANGRRNAWLMGDPKRIGQTRTPPWLSEVIEPLKQLERYTEAELMAAVISGMFTVFIKSEPGTGPDDMLPGTAAADDGGWNGQLGNGTAVGLAEGESIETANPGRPNSQFDPFVQSIIHQIGAVLQIPHEVLIKKYQSSYSASKAAMLDAWRFFRERRAWLVGEFCQPIFDMWLDEAVASGRISAPGYFSDPVRRMAYRGAEWVGDGMGTIDPAKDATAAEKRIELGISTIAAESLLHDGQNWEDKHRQRVREHAARKEAGLIEDTAPTVAAPAPDPDDDD